ncbi:MAG: flagellar hook basal-body protein [Planctomycetota bacterium]
MIYGMYLSTAGAKAQSLRQDVIANNLANTDTTGFKRQFAILQARNDHGSEFGAPPPFLANDPRNIQGGVHLVDTPGDLQTQGNVKATGRQYDFLVNGDGYFQINRGGRTFLTRSGAFAVDSRGVLVSADGQGQVMSTNGGPIRIDPAEPIGVDDVGRIFQNNNQVGQIALRSPTNPNDMARQGDGLYAYDGPLRPSTGTIRQNMLEGSNVAPITEMVDMIETARAFDMNIQMIQLQNDGLANLLQTVARLQ